MELIIKETVAHVNLMLVHDLLWPKGEVKQPEIYVYYIDPAQGKGEEAWVRFEREDGSSNTFWLNKKLVDTLIKSPLVCMDSRIVEQLATMVPAVYELPKEWLAPADSHPMDSFTQGDFWTIDSTTAKLSKDIAHQVKAILLLSKRLRPLTAERVYDLYMSMNVNQEDLTQFKLSFDKIYPKLPDVKDEHEELTPIIIGIQPTMGLEKNDNPTWNSVVVKLRSLERLINNYITRAIHASGLKGAPLDYLKKDITSILMATSHYTGKVFGYDGEHGKELLDQVANGIVTTLRKYHTPGRDIRLDISSWVVWEYEPGKEPVRAPEPELNFYSTIMESYTDSFVDLLGPILMNSGHTDIIRPYQHHVKADLSDGRAIGTMQRVIKKPVE